MVFEKRVGFGFTLSEVLIALGIIGVVAAMTIPYLVQNYLKTQTVVQLQKVYSELSRAVKMSEMDNGELSTWTFGTKAFDTDEVNAFVETYLIPYLKLTKNCGTSDATCTSKNRPDLNGVANNVYKMPVGISCNYKFILGDGAVVWVNTYINSTNIFVDINGDKKPNMFGKDTFAFFITPTNKKLKFWGEGTPRNSLLNGSEGCNKTAGNVAGGVCGALIQVDGWEIKDDYPWK